MADTKPQPHKRRVLKKAPTPTIRQRASQAPSGSKKLRRLRSGSQTATRPLRAAAQFSKVEFYLPMPDSRLGRFLNKRRYWIPRYFREAWHEVRQVKWPNRKETRHMTVAVFIFAIVFAVVIASVDYGLDQVFKKVLLN